MTTPARAPRPSRRQAISGLAALALAMLAAAAAACGSESELQGGTADAHQVAFELEIGDGWIRDARAPADALDLRVPAHSDLTLHVTNLGTAPHRVALVAGAGDDAVEVATSELLAPGAAGAVRYHVHDAQRLRVTDPTDPRVAGSVVVGP